MFVYFPVRPVGTSSKFPSYWRGPFKISGILSDVLCKVNCGRNGSDQPIHCNRIQACKVQILSGESIVPIADTNIETGLSEGCDDQNRRGDEMHPPMLENETEIDMTENEVEVQEISSGRRSKKSVWAKDYVFCFRSTMAKTKTTPRAEAPVTQQSQRIAIPAPRTICPVGKEFVEGKTEVFEKHLIECYKGCPSVVYVGKLSD